MNKLDFRKLREFDNHKLVIKIEDKEAGKRQEIAENFKKMFKL